MIAGGAALAIGGVEITEHQHIDPALQIAGDGVLWRGDDRFLAVEAGIEQHRYAGQTAKFLDQSIVAWIGGSIDRLDTAGTVDVDGSSNAAFAVGEHAWCQRHE